MIKWQEPIVYDRWILISSLILIVFGLLIISCFVLLLAVLIPGIGRVVNGSRRWIHLGFISLQISEAVKLMAILYLAGFLQRHLKEVQTQLSGFMKPLLFFGVIGVLLLCEPDFG